MDFNKEARLIIIGIIGIIGLILPFFSLNLFIFSSTISGIEMILSLFKGLGMIFNASTSPFVSEIASFGLGRMKPDDSISSIFLIGFAIYIWTGPLVFLIKFIKMIYYGAQQKYYKCGFTYVVIYIIICFILLFVLSAETKKFMIGLIGFGYYISVAAVIYGNVFAENKISTGGVKPLKIEVTDEDEMSNLPIEKEINKPGSRTQMQNYMERQSSTINDLDSQRISEKATLDKLKKYIDEANYLPERIGCPFCHKAVRLDVEERKTYKFICPGCDNNVDMRIK